jgi:D-serine deaminase-like pyridoxal phosphate-dependent protein
VTHAAATPALVLDRDVLERNVARMADHAAELGVELWPHVKTHKCAEVIRAQLAAGAAGVTVATPAEAELAHAAGARAILVAHPPVQADRLARIVALAAAVRVRVALDSEAAAEALDAACRAAGVEAAWLWELDCGTGRCGTAPGDATAERVAALAGRLRGARFEGLMTFGGHAYGGDVRAAAADERDALAVTAAALERRGVPVAARSAGTTPTTWALQEAGPVTELRPGNYVFHDATQVALGAAGWQDCALTVQGTVVSRPDPRRVILDAGSKALAAERMTPLTPDLGHVSGHPGLTVERLYEEHAILTAAEPVDLPVGARLAIVPNHACAAANLHARMVVLAGGVRVGEWAVAARGWDPVAQPD